ncbi:right-handed parallel beta-helix repeat-containing protein [Roseibacillus ishigakijimensis]|uniref:right-handed parallel beta-helix repeat-containing protein n=1 Tax=Roseibacillus ishigakijimensis TaxID=454146 RepID=UPI00367070E8
MDQTTLPAAISAAGPGDRIELANGTYSLSGTLNINKSLTIVGESESGVIIDASGNGASWGIKVQADDVTLDTFTMRPPLVPGSVGTSGGGGYAIHAQFDAGIPQAHKNLTLANITIRDGNRSSFDVNGYDGVTLTNLTATGNAVGNGIQVSGCTDVIMTGCEVSGNAWGAIAVYVSKPGQLNRPSSNVVFDFTANPDLEGIFYIEDQDGLTNSGIAVDGASHKVVGKGSTTQHLFLNTGDEDDAFALMDAIEARFPTSLAAYDLATGHLIVNPAGEAGVIQAAIDAAEEGDVIALPAGIFTEELVIDKRISLRGALAGKSAGIVTDSLWNDEQNRTILDGGIIVRAAQAGVDGIDIRNGRGYGSRKVGIAVEAERVSIRNVFISDVYVASESNYDGLVTTPSTNHLLFADSTVLSCWRPIYLNPGDGHVVAGNFLEGPSGSGVGIGSDGLSSFSLVSNRITGFTEGWGSSAVGQNVRARNNDLDGNFIAVGQYSGDPIDARENLWDKPTGPDENDVLGSVDAADHYTTASQVTNQPITNSRTGVAYSLIQDAHNAAAPGDTILVGDGTYVEDLLLSKQVSLQGSGPDTCILSGAIGGGQATVRIETSEVSVSGLTITREGNNPTDWNDSSLNLAGIAIQGQGFTGIAVHDNRITGNRTGIDLNNTSGHTIRNNVIDNNHTGTILRNQTDDLLVTENFITNNRTVGILFLDASGGSNSPLQQAQNANFSNNDISGNWYGQVVDRQAGGSLPAPGGNLKNFANNWFGTTNPSFTNSNSGEPGYAVLIPVAYGGSAEAPASSQPDFAGPASANLTIVPLFTDGTDTDIDSGNGWGIYGFQGEATSVGTPVYNVTQDTHHATLERAIAAAVAGDELALSGTFTLSTTVTLDKELVLNGDHDNEGTNALITGTADALFHFGAGSDSSEIKNLDFDATGVTALSFEPNLSGLSITDSTFANLTAPATFPQGVIATVSTNDTSNTNGWMVENGAFVTFTGNTWGSGNTADITLLAPASSSDAIHYGAPYDTPGLFPQEGSLVALAQANDGANIVDQRGIVSLNLTQSRGYTTIQNAIDETDSADTVEVYPGTYVENVVTTVPVTLRQATGTMGVVTIAPATGIGVDLADGIDAATRSILQDVTIQGPGSSGISAGSFVTVANVTSSGFTYGINIREGQDVCLENSRFDQNTSAGLKIPSTVSLTGLKIGGCNFDNNQFGFYADANKSAEPDLGDVLISGSSFSDNSEKGIYLERLSNAVFSGLQIVGNGQGNTAYPGMGIDLNLKWKAYSNITIKDTFFSGNGFDNDPVNYNPQGALGIKARDDGPNYGSKSASIDNLTIINNVFEDNGMGLTLGEPGQDNPTPTTLTIVYNKFLGDQEKSLANHNVSPVEAGLNYWGSATGPAAGTISGAVDIAPFYTSYDSTNWPTENGLEGLDAPVVNLSQTTYHDTIQEGIDAAVPGDTLHLKGTFGPSSTIELDKPLTIDGDGDSDGNKALVIGSFGSPAGYFLHATASSAGSTLKNIAFEKSDKNGTQNLIYVGGDDLTFDALNFDGQYETGDGEVSRAFEVAGGATGLTISHSTFDKLRQPAYINPGAEVAVTNNSTKRSKGWVIGNGAVVTFSGNTWGMENDPEESGVDTRNITSASPLVITDIALLGSNANPADPAEARYYGAPYDTPGLFPQNGSLDALVAANNGASIDDQRGIVALNTTQSLGYTTIQFAIDETIAGDTVEVYPGTYDENVITTVPVTLRKGTGTTGAVIIAPTSGNGVFLADGSDAMTRSILQDVTVQGSGGSTRGIQAGSFATLSHVISTGSRYGVELTGGEDLAIENSSFDNNTSSGLKIPSTVNVTGLTVEGSTFDGNGFGFYADADSGVQPDLDGVVITNSSFSNNTNKGIYTERLSNAVLSGLTISHNLSTGSAGISISVLHKSYANLTIKDSLFSGNTGAALVVKALGAATLSNVTICNNVFEGTNGKGLVIGENGMASPAPSGLLIKDNKFFENTDSSLENHTGTSINADFNFWGSSAGPEGNDLVGDTIGIAPFYTNYDGTNWPTVTGLSGLDAPVVNVTAMPDPTYHDTIQEGIDSATDDDVLHLKGTFNPTSTIVLNKKLTLDGDGDTTGTKARIVANSSAPASNVMRVPAASGDGSLIQNIEFELADDISKNLITIQGSDLIFTNLDFSGQWLFPSNRVSRAFEVSGGVSGLTISESTFDKLRQPAYLNPGAEVTVINNSTKRTKGWVVDNGAVVTFSGNSWGLESDPALGDADTRNITDTSSIPFTVTDIALLGHNSDPSVPRYYGAPYDTEGELPEESLTALSDLNNGALIDDQREIRVINLTETDNNLRGSTGIQFAIGRAGDNHELLVAPGTYEEFVTIDKSGLKLTSAEGKGMTTISPPAGHPGTALGTVLVTPNTDGVQLGDLDAGFTIVGFDGASSGIESAAVYFQGAHAGATVTGNCLVADGDSAFLTEYNFINSDFILSHNEFTGTTFTGGSPGGSYGDSQWTTANYPRILVAVNGPLATNVSFTNNEITGIAGNGTDHGASLVMFYDSIAGLTVRENNFGGITAGGAGTASPRSSLVLHGTGVEVENNVFSATAPIAFRTLSAVDSLKDNSFIGNNAFYTVANDFAGELDASENHWNSENGPTDEMNKLYGDVIFSPWFAASNGLPAPDLELSDLRSTLANDNIDDMEIDSPVVVSGSFHIAKGQTITVTPEGSLTVPSLTSAAGDGALEGGKLIVDRGSLTIGDPSGTSILNGSFIVFNSFGSMDITDDTTITSTGFGLTWVSDIHVAAGKTVTVEGLLSWDGCVIDSQTPTSPFNLIVADGGRLVLARSEVSDAAVTIDTGGEADIYDNLILAGSTITGSPGSDAHVYHNIIPNDLAPFPAVLMGDLTTAESGWSNVSDRIDTRNNLTLEFQQPDDVTRTLEMNAVTGLYDLYLQPGDGFKVGLDVSALTEAIDTVDAKIAYSYSLLEPWNPANPNPDYELDAPWGNMHAVSEDLEGVIGLISSGTGQSLESSSPTAEDDQVVRYLLTARSDAPDTVSGIFFRPDLHDSAIAETEFDNPASTNELSRPSGANPSEAIRLTPFTANTGRLIIDGTTPEVDYATAPTGYQAQASIGSVDVFGSGELAVREAGAPIVIHFLTADNLAGIDDEDVVVTATSGSTTLTADRSSSDLGIDDDDHTFDLAVPSVGAPSGTYSVNVEVRDRSGNVANFPLGTFTLTDEVHATVQLDGFEGAAREVTFKATDSSGAVLGTWEDVLVDFTADPMGEGNFGMVSLTSIPAGTVAISAKTDWTLRKRLSVSLTDGYGSISLTAAHDNPSDSHDGMLTAGDFDGDNIVKGTDYTLLRHVYNKVLNEEENIFPEIGDITGDGVTTRSDYDQFVINYFTVGAPE